MRKDYASRLCVTSSRRALSSGARRGACTQTDLDAPETSVCKKVPGDGATQVSKFFVAAVHLICSWSPLSRPLDTRMVLGPSSNGGLASLLLGAGAITAVVLFAGGGSGGGGYAPPLAEGEGVVEEAEEALPDIWSHRPPMPTCRRVRGAMTARSSSSTYRRIN